MFILPLGDNVNHRSFPVGAIALVMVNMIVLVHMNRIVADDHKDKDIQAFVNTWALIPADLHQGYFVGLGTHMFLHANWMHLLGNMFFLWAFAFSLELSLGTLPFLALYFVWGLAAAFLQLYLTPGDSRIPMVGASGAIAGLMGAYLVAFGLFTKIRTLVFIFIRGFVVKIPAFVFLVVWLLLQFQGIAAAHEEDQKPQRGRSWSHVRAHAHGGVAWFAHLGGFGAGALTMLVLGKGTKARLVQDEFGQLELEEKPAPTPPEEEQVEFEEPARPDGCPYCGAPLDGCDQLATVLLRCPNPNCRRCIYIETPLAVGGR